MKKSLDQYFNYFINLLRLKPGLSFIIRAKNEEENIKNCILSIIDIADEIIFVDNQSTDATLRIGEDLAHKYKNIKVYEYDIQIPKCGEEQRISVMNHSDNTIASYYNWCASKATRYNIVKWDADFIANRKNLIAMIKMYNLRRRRDKFSMWFVGNTVFTNGARYYINEDTTVYDEFRCYSKLNGFMWKDNDNWEYPDWDYVADSREHRYFEPCFYEIKTVKKDLFLSSRTDGKPLDFRDKNDSAILQKLKSKRIFSGNDSIKPLLSFDKIIKNVKIKQNVS